jgi:hypothetical protein
MRYFAHPLVLAFALGLAFALPATAAERWQKGFHINGLIGDVHDALVYDDGSGRALYLAGVMVYADDVRVNYLARWDGTRFSAVGGGFDGPVRALAAFDDGSGMALYAGGEFTQAGGQPADSIARWNGTAWQPVTGANYFPSTIYDLHVWDDGEGPALYAAGISSLYFLPGKSACSGIARWDGKSWEPLRFGFRLSSGTATAYAVMDFDDGSGSDLYVVGDFNRLANGEFQHEQIRSNYVGRWDGDVWSEVGGGLPWRAAGLTVFDFGSGPRLIAGAINGGFSGPDSSTSQWDGSSWSQLGSGLRGTVQHFQVFDDGSGPKLYAGGGMNTASPYLVRWQNGNWAPLGSKLTSDVGAMAVVDFGPSPGLYVGGNFRLNEPGTVTWCFARWDGTALRPVTGMAQGKGAGGAIYTLASRKDALGGKLFAGGVFSSIGGAVTNSVASLDAGQWSQLGAGLGGLVTPSVRELEIFDDGAAASLIATGSFHNAGGDPAIDELGRWDGASWHAMFEFEFDNSFDAVDDFLATNLEGPPNLAGPRLWLSGRFASLDQVPGALNVAGWDGTEFSALDLGVGVAGTIQRVRSLAAFDDGNGVAIYVAGSFLEASGVPAVRIARWDGTAWSAVGTTGFNGAMYQLHVHDDGTGPALYAAGFFTEVDGQAISGLARWDGQQWSKVGGVDFTMNGTSENIEALASFDDGTGPKLAIGGRFRGPLGPGSHTLVFWDGQQFSLPEGGEPNGFVRALRVHHDGDSQKLYVAGDFLRIGDLPSYFMNAYDTFLLFENGFESGDTSAWSSAMP